MAHDNNFITKGNFILGAPIETKKHIKKTIKGACSLPLDFAFFYPLMYHKGSDLWLEALRDGKINAIDHAVLADKNRKLGNFTSDELMRMCKRAYNEFYYRPNYLIKQLFKAFKNQDFRIINAFIRYKKAWDKEKSQQIISYVNSS